MMYFDQLEQYVGRDNMSDYIETEMDRLNRDALPTTIDRKVLFENVTDDLLNEYYTNRQNVNKRSRNSQNRDQMLAFDHAIIGTITIAYRVGYAYREEYIKAWEKRASWFPYGELMRDFAQRIQSQQNSSNPVATQPEAGGCQPAEPKAQPLTLDSFIKKDRDKVRRFIDDQLKLYNSNKKAGKMVAGIIVVLNQEGYFIAYDKFKRELYDAFCRAYPNRIGTFSGINQYLNQYNKNMVSDKKLTTDFLDRLKSQL